MSITALSFRSGPTDLSWIRTGAQAGETVYLRADATGMENQTINVQVWEDDGIGDDLIATVPITIGAQGFGTHQWTATWQPADEDAPFNRYYLYYDVPGSLNDLYSDAPNTGHFMVSPPVSNTITGAAVDGADTTPVTLERIDSLNAIDPALPTWVVIHGRASSAWDPLITVLADALSTTRPADQVLTLDWHYGAAGSGVDFTGERWIAPVGGWASSVMADYGFTTSQLNLVGWSWGGVITSEFSARFPGGVHQIVALDPAEDAPGPGQFGFTFINGTTYDTDTANFRAHSDYSWAFYSQAPQFEWDSLIGANAGNEGTPTTADEAIVVLGSSHSDVVRLFANMLVNNDDVSSEFHLNQTPVWQQDRFNSGGGSAGDYEAVLWTVKGGTVPALLKYVSSNNQDTYRKNSTAYNSVFPGPGSTLNILTSPGVSLIDVKEDSVAININGQQVGHYDASAFSPNGNGIDRIVVFAGDGGGQFDFRNSLVPIAFYGGDGDDEIYGSRFNDIIYCGGGTDFVRAGDGADEIYAIAGSGNRLFGGAGDDVIHGSDGGDYITGGADSDTIIVGPSDYVVDATAEDYVSIMNDRVVQRRQDRINSRQQEQQNVASPQQGGVQVSAAATPEITDFTINQNVVTEGESVVFTVYAAEPNWARLVLFVDEDGNGQYNANVDTELGQFRGRNQNWRGQIGTVKLGPGTFDVYAMLLPFSGSAAVSAPITLTVEEEVVLPEPPSMPDAVQINPDDILILLPHRNGDVTVPGNTLVGNGIDLWELTPRTGGGFAFWTEGTSDTIVALYDADGNRIGQWDSSSGPDENGELVVTLNDDTTYYIAVAAESGDGGDYDLYVTGHNQTTAGAISLDPSTHAGSVSASFSDNHRLDYFSLLSPEGATVLDVTVDSDPSMELWVRVADENNNLIGLGRPGDQILTGLPVEPNTIYYVTAFSMYGTDGSYTVTADFYPDESGLPAELSPSPEAEWLVPMPDGSLQVEGLSIDVPAEFDYYLLTPRSLPLVIETTGSLDTRIGLYQRFSDSNSSLVAENDDGGDGRNARLVIDQAEEYIVLVRSGNDETGSYSLSISSPAVGIAGLMPTGLEATVSSSVGAILNNERYHIYRTEVPAFSNTLDLTMEYIPTAAHPEDWVLDAWVRISDADGNVVRILDAGGEQANEMVQDLSVSPGATYYITVAGKDFTIGQYQLHLDYNPDYPVTSGNEFPISSISNSNEWPDVDRNAAGQGVVVWNANIYEDGFGYNTIHALRIGPDGQPAGTEVELYRGSYDSPSFHPVVAVAPDGTSVVAWNNVFRRFSATGVPLSGETEFASATQSPTETDIAMGPAGEFVIVWTSFNNGDSDGGIFAQRYNASGSPAGSEIHVNQTTDGYQGSPQVAYLSNGQWVVTWHSVLHSTDSLDVAARAFSDGAPVTDDFTVNTTLPRYQGTPMIAASPDGYGYVILWMSQRADGVWYGDAQRFSDEHLPLGDEFQATTSPLAGSGVFTEPCIAFGSQGRFLVVSVTGDTSGKGIAAQQYDAQGHRVGPELILNQEEANDQDTPAIASDQDDRFLLAWRSGVSGALAIKGLEYPLSDINEPEITVLDSAGTPDDLTIDFGQLVSAGAPVAYDVTIRNDGNAELSVTHLVLSGNGAAAFSLDDDTAFTLQGGQSRTLTVTFDPANSGSYAAALTIEHNDTSDVASGDVDPVPLFVNLTAEVVDSPKLDVTILPGTISETAGNGAAAVLVTRRNVSDADLALPLSITLSSSDETEAVISGTAQIPAEQMSVVVYVDAVDDFEDDGTQSVVISASAEGLASGGAFLEVESANHPPLLEPVDGWAIELGQTVSFTAVASDPDNPPDGLTFSLIGDFPPEATIDGASGVFSWTPVASDAGQTRLFAIRVVDDGDPQLSDTIAFTVTVNDSTVPAAPAVTSPALQVTVNADTYLIEGTAEADCLVTVYIDTNNNNQVDAGEPVAGQQQLAGGAIEFSVLVGLTQDAANDFVVIATDAVGNVSLATDVPTITEDSIPPLVTLTAPAGTSNPMPSVTVTATDNGAAVPDGTLARLDLDLNGDGDFADPGESGIAMASLTAGTATFTAPSALPDGVYHTRAHVSDLAGNEGISDVATTVIDTVRPAPPVVTSPAAPVVVNADTYLLEGTAEQNALVTVFVDTNNNNQVDDGEPVAGQQQLAGGAIGFSVLVALTQDAANDFVVIATDAVGNVSPATDVPTISESDDTTPPDAPTIDAITEDTGAADGITNDPTLTFAGTAEASAQIELFKNTTSIGTTTANGSGIWNFDYTATDLDEGTYIFTATARDVAGNVSDLSAGFLVIIDVTPPTVTVESMLTNDTTPMIIGAVSDGMLQVVVNGRTYTAGDGSLSVSGTDWMLQIPPEDALADGTYDVVATATDLADNTGTDETVNELVVQAIPTVLLTLAGSPMAEAEGVATLTATLSWPWSQNVTVNLGFAGTATLIDDYTPSEMQITIPAGSVSHSITLTAAPDTLDEFDETIVIDITDVTNGTELNTQQVTAVITDDDAPGGVLHRETGHVYPTITEAIAAAGAGDHLLVYDGIYTESIVLNKPLTVEAATIGGAILDAGHVDALVLVNSDSTLIGLHLRGAYQGIKVRDTGAHFTAQYCIASACDTAFSVNNSVGQSGSGDVLNCTIVDCYQAVGINDGGTIQVRNTIIDGVDVAYTTYNGVAIIPDHNLLHNVTSIAVGSGISSDSAQIVADPMFVDRGSYDFRLQTGSSAIDSGTDLGLPYLGAAPDRGAREYRPPVPVVSDPAVEITVDADTYRIEGTAEPNCLVTVYIDTNNNSQVDDGEPWLANSSYVASTPMAY